MSPVTEFEKDSQKRRPSILGEVFGFLAHNKKWWLLPIFLCLGLLALLAIFATSGAAPFIYTLF